MHHSYKVVILYALAFVVLLVGSAVAIYSTKLGYLPSEVLLYYLGDEYSPPKTALGLLKVHLPHTFVFGLFGFVLLHLLLFTQFQTQSTKLAFLFFTSAFFELLSSGAIIYGLAFFATIKIVSFLVLMGCILYISALLALDILRPAKGC